MLHTLQEISMRSLPRTLALAATFLWGALVALPAAAQPYPSSTVRIVVTFPPGGPLDIISRTLAAKLGELWGQQVIVENKPGGNTLIGADYVARAVPDGYTLMMAIDSTLVMNQHLYAKLPYDPIKGFTPISQTSSLNQVFAVNAASPYKTIADLVAAAQAKPGKLTVGAGSVSTQLCAELFKSMAKADLLFVPYKGSAPTVQALLAGEIDLTCDGIPGTLPHIKGGKLRPLAMSGPRRFTGMADVPTLEESGIKGFEFVVWTVLVGPAGMSPDVVAKVASDVKRVLAMPDVRERLVGLGVDVSASTPEELAALIRRDAAKWAEPIKKSGIKLD
jgi:tripartite-type tricarboxylate transporter receptor subunit TctC